jgi:hypothetical protein
MFNSKMYWRAHSLNVVLFAAMLDLGRSKPLHGLLWFTLLVAKFVCQFHAENERGTTGTKDLCGHFMTTWWEEWVKRALGLVLLHFLFPKGVLQNSLGVQYTVLLYVV